jgi:hypothetical protein
VQCASGRRAVARSVRGAGEGRQEDLRHRAGLYKQGKYAECAAKFEEAYQLHPPARRMRDVAAAEVAESQGAALKTLRLEWLARPVL